MAQTSLETPRLLLRPLRESDAGLITLYASDARVARMTRSIPHPLPPGAIEAFVERVTAGNGDEAVWAMDHKGSAAGELVGLIGLGEGGDLGYWVGAPFWSTGFATEAVAAVAGWAFGQGLSSLAAEVFQDNPASAKVLTKAGFSYSGVGETYSAARAALVPVWRYGLGHDAWARAADGTA